MKIYLTFDYELYFGHPAGSADKCLIEPTDLIRSATEPFSVFTTQFVDTGYLKKLKAESVNHPELNKDYNNVITQLKSMSEAGHELQLHIHPHWEDSNFVNGEWQMNTKRYRLHHFSREEVQRIVIEYLGVLKEIASNRITTFRAGGWCLQPFNHIYEALKSAGIKIDSSVFPGGHYESGHYFYDFRKSPQKSIWKFEEDPLRPEVNGYFTEVPITSIQNSPLFYWKLFLLGRLFPGYHKPIGDGRPIPAPGQRKKLLSQYTLQTVSLDGYNAALLEKALRQQEKLKAEHMVVIGHPKALTRYGADALERFVKNNYRRHQFSIFNPLCGDDTATAS